MKRDYKFLTQNLIAHRGLHSIENKIPENSILAFEKAIEKNYIIELDVHILKDGNVVVFHDDNLKRMIGINKMIKDMTYQEIRSLRLQNTSQKIPLFKDVLKLINGKVPIIIELKYDVKYGILEKEVINILKDYKGEYAIQSFRPTTLYYFKKNAPNVIRGQLSSDFKNKKMNKIKKYLYKNMLLNSITKPDFIAYDIRSLSTKKISKKYLVLGWTIKNEIDFEKAEKYCDNYICENIEKLKYKGEKYGNK